MFRAMAVKELREVRGIALLALAAYVVVIWFMALVLKSHPEGTPFVRDGFLQGYIVVSGALAVALGLRQTLGESIGGTYPFLFHRPATRPWLIGMKLLVGLAVYLPCGLLPIVIYGLIAATPGVYASPVEWAMSGPTLLAWLTMSVLYFGAFLSGIRPGRWYYSRLFPLVGAGLASLVVIPCYLYFGDVAPLIAIFLIDACLVALILFVARTRDYA